MIFLPNHTSVVSTVFKIRYGTVVYVHVHVFDLGYCLFQSIWSSPGPSPLEKLLEMQKQQRTTDPH